MADMTLVQKLIADECDALKQMLLDKNRKYGNSALNPVRGMSRAPVDEQIRVRIDDKWSRLTRGEPGDEDVEMGLMGYLVLLRVQRRLSQPTDVASDAATPSSNLGVVARGTAHTTLAEQVREFQAMLGRPAPTAPQVPDDHTVRLRLKLIAEEFLELLRDATGAQFPTKMKRIRELVWSVIEAQDSIAVNLPAFADALADLDYVVEGTRQEFGIDGAPIAAAVHRANMAKQAGPVDPATGKKLKPAGWAPPDIEGQLRAQGWS